jgi:hypothetical protein
MIAQKINALLVIPAGSVQGQGLVRRERWRTKGASVSMVEDVMATMRREKVVSSTGNVARVIVTAHSGGYRPAGIRAGPGRDV